MVLSSTLVAILGAFGGACAAEIARRIFERRPITNEARERARRIYSATDPTVENIRSLYETVDNRLPRSELVEWELLLQTIESSLVAEHVVGKWRHSTILIVGERASGAESPYIPKGLLYFHASWTKGVGFGSIFKNDNREAREEGPGLAPISTLTRLMFKKLRKSLRGPLWLRPINNILFEIADPDSSDLAESRRIFFTKLAKERGYTLNRIDWVYKQPFPDPVTFANSEPGTELPMWLVLATKSRESSVSRSQLKKYIRFICDDIYGSVINDDDPADLPYRGYLTSFRRSECQKIDRSGCAGFRLLPLDPHKRMPI
jgi:hypothetical protein